MDLVIWLGSIVLTLGFWYGLNRRYSLPEETEETPEAPKVIRCSCGAVQFPQAAFCHWCGKGIDVQLSPEEIKRKLVQLRSKMNKAMEPLTGRVAELAPESLWELNFPFSLSEKYRYLNFTIQGNKNLPKGHIRAYGSSGKLYVA